MPKKKATNQIKPTTTTTTTNIVTMNDSSSSSSSSSSSQPVDVVIVDEKTLLNEIVDIKTINMHERVSFFHYLRDYHNLSTQAKGNKPKFNPSKLHQLLHTLSSVGSLRVDMDRLRFRETGNADRLCKLNAGAKNGTYTWKCINGNLEKNPSIPYPMSRSGRQYQYINNKNLDKNYSQWTLYEAIKICHSPYKTFKAQLNLRCGAQSEEVPRWLDMLKDYTMPLSSMVKCDPSRDEKADSMFISFGKTIMNQFLNSNSGVESNNHTANAEQQYSLTKGDLQVLMGKEIIDGIRIPYYPYNVQRELLRTFIEIQSETNSFSTEVQKLLSYYYCGVMFDDSETLRKMEEMMGNSRGVQYPLGYERQCNLYLRCMDVPHEQDPDGKATYGKSGGFKRGKSRFSMLLHSDGPEDRFIFSKKIKGGGLKLENAFINSFNKSNLNGEKNNEGDSSNSSSNSLDEVNNESNSSSSNSSENGDNVVDGRVTPDGTIPDNVEVAEVVATVVQNNNNNDDGDDGDNDDDDNTVDDIPLSDIPSWEDVLQHLNNFHNVRKANVLKKLLNIPRKEKMTIKDHLLPRLQQQDDKWTSLLQIAAKTPNKVNKRKRTEPNAKPMEKPKAKHRRFGK